MNVLRVLTVPENVPSTEILSALTFSGAALLIVSVNFVVYAASDDTAKNTASTENINAVIILCLMIFPPSLLP